MAKDADNSVKGFKNKNSKSMFNTLQEGIFPLRSGLENLPSFPHYELAYLLLNSLITQPSSGHTPASAVVPIGSERIECISGALIAASVLSPVPKLTNGTGRDGRPSKKTRRGSPDNAISSSRSHCAFVASLHDSFYSLPAICLGSSFPFSPSLLYLLKRREPTNPCGRRSRSKYTTACCRSLPLEQLLFAFCLGCLCLFLFFQPFLSPTNC